MSVTRSPASAAGWRGLWPVCVLALLILICAGGLWFYWPQILLQSVVWQKNLHQQMTALLQQVASDPHRAGITLMGFSLLYGILHALGPGHGKVVIATFLATHPTRVKTSLTLTAMAAVVQGAAAVILVTLFLSVLNLSSRQLHLGSWRLEQASYLLVAGLGLWLCWRAGRKLIPAMRRASGSRAIRRIVPLDHQHNDRCGCGHQHVPNARQLAAVGWKTKSLVVLSMGMRPCSGAIMMLLFAKVIGVYGWGILSAVVMALGTAITVSAMALLVQVSRWFAIRLTQHRSQAAWQSMALHCLALCGGLLLLAAGLILWLSAQPAVSGGLRPLFVR